MAARTGAACLLMLRRLVQRDTLSVSLLSPQQEPLLMPTCATDACGHRCNTPKSDHDHDLSA
jgi:hypothetical protein